MSCWICALRSEYQCVYSIPHVMTAKTNSAILFIATYLHVLAPLVTPFPFLLSIHVNVLFTLYTLALCLLLLQKYTVWQIMHSCANIFLQIRKKKENMVGWCHVFPMQIAEIITGCISSSEWQLTSASQMIIPILNQRFIDHQLWRKTAYEFISWVNCPWS